MVERFESISSSQQEWDGVIDADSPINWEGTGMPNTPANRLVSLFVEAPHLTPKAFLSGAYGRERFYWSEPSTVRTARFSLAGIGVAAEIHVPPIIDNDESPNPPGFRFGEIQRLAHALFKESLVRESNQVNRQHGKPCWEDHPARPRLFGGFAFKDDFIPDNTWSVFSTAQFVLPHYQLVQWSSQTFLTINTLISPGEDLDESIEGMREALETQIALSRESTVHHAKRPELRYPMTREAWKEIVQRATNSIHDGRLAKVVLSRVCEVRFDESIDGAAPLDYLEDQYGDCYRFLFEPAPMHAFFGASPELLVRKCGDEVTTMALAGSIGRGRTPDEDKSMALSLLNSAKDRHEHHLVVQAIRKNLEEAGVTPKIAQQPVVMPLRNIQHLLTPIHGKVAANETTLVDLVCRLHPTPAMGGVPTERAMTFLRENELVPRGWYAAPIGWMDSRLDGVFAVAIRSAVTQYNRAWLYAGAGIVGESDPGREWNETALKFRPMLGAFGIEEES